MYKEDDILIGRKAKDETEDFINEHLENPEQGWPTFRFNTGESLNDYKELKHNKHNAMLNLFFI
ncbi:MAG: hypothetical protein JXA96_02090 [Sedimentisphaerales bacterium]|nr:hypothetical protein [Sedimentisphaerales bacterium]